MHTVLNSGFVHTLPKEQASTVQQILFRGVMTPSLLPVRPGLHSTDVGLFLSVSLSLSLPLHPPASLRGTMVSACCFQSTRCLNAPCVRHASDRFAHVGSMPRTTRQCVWRWDANITPLAICRRTVLLSFEGPPPRACREHSFWRWWSRCFTEQPLRTVLSMRSETVRPCCQPVSCTTPTQIEPLQSKSALTLQTL